MNTGQLPLYAQLKESIIHDIRAGQLKPQDKLPSHSELCDVHNVSYMTMRRAINELVNEGMLYGVPGKGVYVAEPKEVAEMDPLLSFTEDMARRGKVASSRLLSAELYEASTIMAQVLKVQPGDPLVHLVRLRLADRMPVAIQRVTLRYALCPGILDYDLESGSLYAILRENYGLELAATEGTASAALAGEEEAELFGIELPAALLVTEQVSYLGSGEPVEVAHARYRGDRYGMPLPRVRGQ